MATSFVIYDDDGRKEYFEVEDPALRSRIAGAVVSIVPKSSLLDLKSGAADHAESLGDLAKLCSGERFAEQPAAALCTGVLVDWDLVLTGGHCVRLLALEDLAIVFGYYYSAPGELAFSRGDAFEAKEIVAEALDPSGVEPRRDYAWVRLTQPARLPRQPAPLRLEPAVTGENIIAVGAANGTPLKVDEGGQVTDRGGLSTGYFVADTDTSHGASGGPAFDTRLDLTGILVRGADDFVESDAGCQETLRLQGASAAQEQFSYASEALAGLCDADARASSLCRHDCGDPCQSTASKQSAAGCTVIAGPVHTPFTMACFALAFGVLCVRPRSRAVLAGRKGPRTG